MAPLLGHGTARAIGRDRDSGTSPALIARLVAGMYLASGLLSLAVYVLPVPSETYKPGFTAIGCAAFACAGVAMFADVERRPWVLTVMGAAGVPLVTAALWASAEANGGPAADIEVLYLWPALLAAHFLGRRGQVAMVAWIGACYLMLLITVAPDHMILTRWVQLMTTLAGVVLVVALLQARMRQLVERLSDAARTDPLTGLQNRRGFEEEIEREVLRARRTEGTIAVVMGDLDEFKRLNDRYGHLAGDAALEGVGSTLATGKRDIDTVARTGGEEFALLLPDTDRRGAYALAERLRMDIDRRFAQAPRLTISFGVACFPDHARSAQGLLKTADRALYAAKRLGRDRTVIFSDQLGEVLGSPGALESEAKEAQLTTLVSLAEALDLRDTGTSDHSETVARLSAMAAQELGLPPSRVERVGIAGRLHDIGKVAVPDSILRKAGPLEEHEWVEMRRHPEIGAQILGNPVFDDLRSWVLAHHERPDGSGYPFGLVAGEIPLEARILAVADAYEAMTADRVYRPPITREAALEELRRCAGSQFDPRVVEAFVAGLDRAVANIGRPA